MDTDKNDASAAIAALLITGGKGNSWQFEFV
jgi:hypothetical protein